MKLSVVVVVYNMRRAATRTLLSLSPRHQQGIRAEDYEVIVVENGSARPLEPDDVHALGENFRYLRIEHASPSPAPAINLGLREARGELIGAFIDGARIVTPRVLQLAVRAASTQPRAVVGTAGWSLGRDPQNWAIARGFDEVKEDALLESIGWPSEPYRLFEIATLDGSSALLGPIAESNTLFMARGLWNELGGMDERFDQPGGGFVNLDTLERALNLPGTELVLLLGEASFHQVHGGISTNSLPHQLASDLEQWHLHYQNLRGQDWRLPKPRTVYYGALPDAYRAHLVEWASQQTLATVPFLRGELERMQEQAEAASAATDEARAALRDAHAQLHALRGSLAFRSANWANGRLHALAPPGTRRGQVSLRARALARVAVRGRRAPWSRAARTELRATLRGFGRDRTDAPEIRHLAAGPGGPPVFEIEAWDEKPVLHEIDVEELLTALWETSARPEGRRPA